MSKLLVTGAAGFIGFHTVRRLLTDGHEVVGLDNLNDYYDPLLKEARLQQCGIAYTRTSGVTFFSSRTYPRYRFVRASIEDKAALQQLFEKERFDHVIHLAAQAGVRYSLENPDVYVQSNVAGFLNVLEMCRYFPVRHLVFASSSSVYGDGVEGPCRETAQADSPVSLYAATKKAGELMAYAYGHLYGMHTTALRFFTVYGPWGRPDMAPVLFADAIAQGKPIQVFNHGDMERDFTYIDDIVEGTVRTVFAPPAPYRVFNIGYGSPSPVTEFIALLEKAMGKTTQKILKPAQPGDVRRTWADVTRLKAHTGYTPHISPAEGAGRFAAWYRQFYP